MKSKSSETITLEINGLKVTIDIVVSASFTENSDTDNFPKTWEIEEIIYETPETSDDGTILSSDDLEVLREMVDEYVESEADFDFYNPQNMVQ